ncbi:MAG: hypothetical protein R3E50_10020 [Halioglobus sp.]
MADPQDEKRSARKRRKLRYRWPAVIGMACLFAFLAWLEPDEDDLFALCSQQGNPTVFRSVNAEGFFYGSAEDCWGCWNYLENTDYKFIEFSISDNKSWGPINEPGIYRASRISTGSVHCHEKLTAFYTRTETGRKLFERNNWCFQLEKFSSRKARYAYYVEDAGTIRSSAVTGSRIYATRIYYFDHDVDEVLAEYTTYSLIKYPFIRISSFATTQSCNDFTREPGQRVLDRQEVIIPVRERSNGVED